MFQPITTLYGHMHQPITHIIGHLYQLIEYHEMDSIIDKASF